MPQITLDGVSFNFHLTGPEAAPPVIFSNSLGAPLEQWDQQLPRIASRFRVLRYDGRGHGRTQIGRLPLTIDDLGGDVIRLADALGIGKFHFVGLSLGGVVGQWLGIHHSERIDRLLLANTAAKLGSRDFWEKRMSDVRINGMKEMSRIIVARWFKPSFFETNPQDVLLARQLIETTSPEGYAACCEVVANFDFRNDVARIKSRTLVVAGLHDVAAPFEDGKWLSEVIPKAKLYPIDAGHITNLEAPEEFTTLINNFFS